MKHESVNSYLRRQARAQAWCRRASAAMILILAGCILYWSAALR